MATQVTGYVVTASDWNEIVNNFIAGATDAMTADGDIWVGTGANAGVKLAAFTSSTGTLKHESGGLELDISAITTGGMLIGASAGLFEILAYGSNDQVLTGVSGKPAWQALAASAITREGGQTSEATTISTSATDLLTGSSLTIAAAEPFILVVGGRKTSGAAANAGIGLKLNTTVILEAVANSGNPALWAASAANNGEAGGFRGICGGRVTNYVDGNMSGVYRIVTVGQTSVGIKSGPRVDQAAAYITAEITSIIIRGITASASQTLGSDELHAYSLTAS